MKDKLRVGIFATTTIEEGAELTFDYRWRPIDGRQPTICFCGAASCRGYLEVLSQSEIEDLQRTNNIFRLRRRVSEEEIAAEAKDLRSSSSATSSSALPMGDLPWSHVS